jgi:hypothetical protein
LKLKVIDGKIIEHGGAAIMSEGLLATGMVRIVNI